MIINKHTGDKAESRTPSLLASGTLNPKRHHYDAEGWIDVIPAEIPEGQVEIPGTRQVAKETGIETVETESIETKEAREAEMAAVAIDRQTAADLDTYGGTIRELAQRLGAFPCIVPGMGYQQISDTIDGHVAGLTGEELSRAVADSVRAKQLYKDRIEPAGIVGERFWRAIAAL